MWIADSTSIDLVDLLGKAGPSVILAFVVVMFLRGDIVSRKTLDEALKQRDQALTLVYDQARLAHRAVDVSVARLEIEGKLAESRAKE
jgi:hypothetical protein